MRCLVIADVHGDLHALNAVVSAAGRVDAIWFLGDALEFGPEPVESVDRLRGLAAAWVAGNHDTDIAAGEDGDGWTLGQVGPAHRALLGGLPARREIDGASLRHTIDPAFSLRPPVASDFATFAGAVCLVGHSHVPYLYVRGANGERRLVEPPIGVAQEILAGERAIANPGSVGSCFVDPNRASYLVYESAGGGTIRLTWHSLPRPAAELVDRIRSRGAIDLANDSAIYAAGQLRDMLETAAEHRAWALNRAR